MMSVPQISPIVKHYHVARIKINHLMTQVNILKKKVFHEKIFVQKEQDQKDIASLKKVIDG